MARDGSGTARIGGGEPAAPMSLLRSILVLGSLSVFAPLSMDLYLPSLPELTADLGTSKSLAQATMSACMIGLGVGQLVAGPLSDRIGRRRPLIVGVVLFTVFSLGCALSQDVVTLLVMRFLQGTAGSAGIVVSMAIARDMYNGVALSRMLSLLALVKAAAPILAPIAGGQLARFMDWRGVFGVLTALGAALIVVSIFSLRETLPAQRRHTGGISSTAHQFRVLWHDRLFIGIVITSALSSTVFFAYLSMSSFVFQEEYGLTPAQFSYIFAGNALAVMSGSQLNGMLVHRLGPRRLYVFALTAEAVTAVVMFGAAALDWGLAAFVVMLIVVQFSQSPANPNKTTLALHDHGERAGTAASVLGMTMFIVGPIVAPLISLVGVSAVTMSATMAAIAVVAALVLWVYVRPLLDRRGL